MEKPLNAFFDDETAGRAGLAARINAGLNPVITGLEYDSRRIKPGNLYFALPGLHADGRSFIPDAIRRGAAAVLYQRELDGYRPDIAYIRVKDARFAMSPAAAAFYGFPSRRLGVLGVTGTEGKSTTVYLIWQLLRLAGKRAGFISTVQFSSGGEARWNPEHQTTPEAPAVHRLLAEMAEAGAEYAVLEASSHGLSPRTNRLGDVAFDAAVMTNVTHEHLEFHGTWEQYRRDKANLFRALDLFPHDKFEAGAVPSFGVINADDKSAAYFAAAVKRRCYHYSTAGAGADLSVRSIESGAGGNRYEIRFGETGRRAWIEDRLPGAFNAGNVLAALLTVSAILGRPIEEFIPLVPSLQPVRGRMTAVSRGQPFEVLVDYAHTPSSFETIFPPLRRRIGRGRIISLFGSAGERDTGKRPLQGRIAAEWSDCIILSDEDPRGEEPAAILREIAAGIEGGKRQWREGEDLFLIPDRPAAVRRALSLARPGDLVLLLGKGHENSIIYSTETRRYDEIGEAEQALAELGFEGPGHP
jgi:UDP-N-acetylmuramoyl-L-alanyl-D-glutamate--2,6-diaminopimelate ligase